MIVRLIVKKRHNVNDIEGETIFKALKLNGFEGINSVERGTVVDIDLNAESEQEALSKAQEMCKRLIVNDVIECYEAQVIAQ